MNAPLMVWSITDRVIENPAVRDAQFRDLQEAGFGGVAAYVRCSRYSWNDPPAQRALAHISMLCKRAGMRFWFGPDPRFVSHLLTRGTDGVELLLFGNSSRSDVWPNLADVADGCFSLRCTLAPRHVHTQTDVAITYTPLDIARVYAVRGVGADGVVAEIRDITRHARMFYNARDGYVEAFGSAPLAGDQWKVCAFFHVRSTHVDFTSPRQLSHYEAMLRGLRKAGCGFHGVMWDEPGFTCTYGSLPFSTAIRKRYRSAAGRLLESDLWKLAFDAPDRSHEKVRRTYFAIVQSAVTQAERRFRSAARRLWGRATDVGIHDTWHFESGDMCDMNHGSMDLWSTVGAKTGGFVDLGGVQQLTDPESPWQSNHAAMTVIAASLGRRSREGVAYNNLWTVGDDNGDGSQRRAMTHCTQIMALFGIRWLAHAYGPVGTVGQERTFLGSPPLPGYPDHSTWKEFPAWNRFMHEELSKVEGKLPLATLGVVFPVEAMYVRTGKRADEAASSLFRLILRLLDAHYHVGVLSSTDLVQGRWEGARFTLARESFGALIVPYPGALSNQLLRTLAGPQGRTLPAFEEPGVSPDRLLELLAEIRDLRPVEAPAGSWVTVTTVADGDIVSLAPSRCGSAFQGVVRYRGSEARIERSNRLMRILFSGEDTPRYLTS